MLVLVVCILLNVLVAVIFKYFSTFKIDVLQAIVVNYFTCVITASIAIGDFSYLQGLGHQSWLLYAAIMGFFFFVIFKVIAQTVEHHGVMVSSTAQKLSLIMPVLVAIFFFKESVTLYKTLGICFAIAAVFFVSYKKGNGNNDLEKKSWIIFLPILTWIGSSFVDVSLYLIDKLQIAPNAGLKFTSALFLFAGLSGAIVLAYNIVTKKSSLDLKSLAAGVVLGIPNFFSIYLVLKLLEDGWNGSVVFPLLNVSIILISALLGVLVFKEDFNQRKGIGFIFALAAIILLALK
jgi:drug/metabolite transporter (DMT)-like permease